MLSGLRACLLAVAAGYGASQASGWLAVVLWVVAVVLFLAGLWTVSFIGLWQLLLRLADRLPDEEED